MTGRHGYPLYDPEQQRRDAEEHFRLTQMNDALENVGVNTGEAFRAISGGRDPSDPMDRWSALGRESRLQERYPSLRPPPGTVPRITSSETVYPPLRFEAGLRTPREYERAVRAGQSTVSAFAFHQLRGEAASGGGYIDRTTGDVTISREQTFQAIGAGKGAFQQAVGQVPQTDPVAWAANIRKIGNKIMSDQLSEMEKAAMKASDDPRAQAETLANIQRVHSVAREAFSTAVSNMERDIRVRGPAMDVAMGATRISVEQLAQRVDPTHPAFAGQFMRQQVGAWGGGPIGGPVTQAQVTAGMAALQAAGGVVTTGPGGPGGGGAIQAFQIGGWGAQGPLGPAPPGGQQRGRGRGVWQGAFGQTLYSMYIARRFWQYTGAPVFQAMDQYRQLAAQLGPMAGAPLQQVLAGVAGAPSRRAMAEYYLGMGAEQQFGWISELTTGLISSPRGGRLAAAGLAGAGAGIGLGIIGAGAFGLAAATAGAIGLGVAAGVGAVALGTEAYNLLTGQEVGIGDVPLLAAQGFASQFNLGGGAGRPMAGTQLALAPLGIETRRQESPEVKAILDGANKLVGSLGLTKQEQAVPIIATAMQITGRSGDDPVTLSLARTIGEQGLRAGMSPEQMLKLSAQYAESRGYIPGTPGFEQAALGFSQPMPLAARTRMMEQTTRAQGMAAVFRQYIPKSEMDDIRLTGFMYRFPTQGQAMMAFAGFRQVQAAGMPTGAALQWAQQFAFVPEQIAQRGLALGAMVQPYVTPAIGQTVAQLGMGLTQPQADLVGAIGGGDLGAINYAVATGQAPGLAGLQTRNLAGQPLFQTSMMGYVQAGIQRALGIGIGGFARSDALQQDAARWFGSAAQLTRVIGAGGYMTPGAFLGTALRQMGVGEAMSQFFQENPKLGLFEYQQEFADRMYGYQMAGIGVGLQRIALQREFLWGGGRGEWRRPAPGSIWEIEDRMRALQWQSQQAGWTFTLERMDVSNRFAIQQEGLLRRRMDLTQGMQRWGFGFQRAGMELQRRWVREDWQFQDQMTQLQTGWRLEDFEEAIRLSAGRERRTLVRQRERFVTTTNLEEEQIERNRTRQEEMWAREDEQFEKRREYAEHLMALDEEQYSLNVERRGTLYDMDRDDLKRRIKEGTELHEMQEEMNSKQREFQVRQLELSEKALGISAAAARAQKEYNDDMMILTESLETQEGIMQNISAYDNMVNILNGIETMGAMLQEVDGSIPALISDMLQYINRVSSAKINNLIALLEAYSYPTTTRR